MTNRKQQNLVSWPKREVLVSVTFHPGSVFSAQDWRERVDPPPPKDNQPTYVTHIQPTGTG